MKKNKIIDLLCFFAMFNSIVWVIYVTPNVYNLFNEEPFTPHFETHFINFFRGMLGIASSHIFLIIASFVNTNRKLKTNK